MNISRHEFIQALKVKRPHIDPKTALRMGMMLLALLVVFGAIFGYKAYSSSQAAKARAHGPPPVTVSAIKAEITEWQPQVKAVGSMRAVRGVNVTSETAGLVRELHFKSGDVVKSGTLLVRLNTDVEAAQLQALEASAELARIVYERDKLQLAAQAISQAALDADEANLKNLRAQVAQQQAVIARKNIRAPFAGKLGISTVNPGQYINAGDVIAPLQSLDPIYIDFYLPQQELSRIRLGQKVSVSTDAYKDSAFPGRITAINPLVDASSRSIQVEATLENRKQLLLPGMYGSVGIAAGAAGRFITVPQTAVTFNPYGSSVYIIEESGKGPDGKPSLAARQRFVTVGETRGDQIAIIKGVNEGETVATSGQHKLKPGSPVVINNQIQPGNDPAPKPADE